MAQQIRTILVIFSIMILVVLFLRCKRILWNEPRNEITKLKESIAKSKNEYEGTIAKMISTYKDSIAKLEKRIENLTEYDAHIVSSEFADIMIGNAWHEILTLDNPRIAKIAAESKHYSKYRSCDIKISMKMRFQEALNCEYKYHFLAYLYPQLSEMFVDNKVADKTVYSVEDRDSKLRNIFEIVDVLANANDVTNQMIILRNRLDVLEMSTSNLKAIPYMAALISDYETYGLEALARQLDWGYSVERQKKVISIRDIRENAKALVERNKEAQYKLAYLLSMFPALEDVLDSEYDQLPKIQLSDLSDYDRTKDYLSREEYHTLTDIERNQLALDRYRTRNRTKWQVGRDYEMFIGYRYSQEGFTVDYYGSYMGLGDLGRDIIAEKDGRTIIIQCKYWSARKAIHEKHILQLYGTVVSYCIENAVSQTNVKGVLITNIKLSDTARKMAEYLKIKYREDVESGSYPCIKCNIGHNNDGETKIYHLPFDQQYDSTKITKPGEFFAFTVEEADSAGFKRASKWLNN